jgi:large subunit ribosomal protein L25
VGSIPTSSTIKKLSFYNIMSITLQAEKYEAGNAKTVREAGRVPAVMYGAGKENQHFSLDAQDFRRAYRKAGKATLLEIELDGKSTPVLIHVVDRHPVSEDFLHIDFHAVDMNKPVHATIGVTFKGTSEAVKLLGGIFMAQKEEIEIKCLPKDLIAGVEADMTLLKDFHSTITVADITFPEAVEVLTAEDVVLATVNAPKKGGASEESEEEGEGEEGADEAEKKEE